MGLDMYLYAEKYISSSNAFKENDPDMYKAGLEAVNMNHLPKGNFPHLMVKADVAYWRKANAIHGWIIRNCADGVDECQEIVISSDKLKDKLYKSTAHIINCRILALFIISLCNTGSFNKKIP